MVTTIQLDESVKKKLDGLKVHRRETYNELLKRLISGYSDADKESLIETIEVMSNPETMKGIARGMEDYQKGRWKSLEQIEKELGIED